MNLQETSQNEFKALLKTMTTEALRFVYELKKQEFKLVADEMNFRFYDDIKIDEEV